MVSFVQFYSSIIHFITVKVLKSIIGILGAVIFGIVALLLGVLVMLYSPWAQKEITTFINQKMSGGDTEISLEGFRLHFPLTFQLDGLGVIADGDTIIGAESVSVDISLLPLFTGKARISELVLNDARYRMGAPDSAMYLDLRADSIMIAPAEVGLSDMSVMLVDGAICGAEMLMELNADTTAATTPSEPTKLSIGVGRLRLEDFDYTMRMMPTIDTLSANISKAELSDGLIDLFNQKIKISSFRGAGLAARYITPDSTSMATAKTKPVQQTDTAASSAPWVISIDTIAFDNSRALYALAGAQPLPGLDFSFLEFGDLQLEVNGFYNRATTVRLPVQLTATERCGVTLTVGGILDIDSVALGFKDIYVNGAEGTALHLDGLLGMGDMASDPSLPLELRLNGVVAPKELGRMFPAFSPYFAGIPSADDVILDADVSGTMGDIAINVLSLKLNRCLSLNARGNLENVMNPALLGGRIVFDGNIVNVDGFKNSLLPKNAASDLKIPPMVLSGDLNMHGGVAAGKINARTHGGLLALDGRWNSRGENYNANLKLREFPFGTFMPLLGVGTVTAELSAKGKGYSPFAKTTSLAAALNVGKAVYEDVEYKDISAGFNLADGKASLTVASDNPDADLSVRASGNLDGNVYRWTAEVDGRHIDLQALKFSQEPASIEATLDADATIGPGMHDIDAALRLKDLFFRRPAGTIAMSNVNAHAIATDSTTAVDLVNRDLSARFIAPLPYDSLFAHFAKVGKLVSEQITNYEINGDTVKKVMPPFELFVDGGRSNLVNDFLAPSKMSVGDFSVKASKDSVLHFFADAQRFDTGSLLLDSIYVKAEEHMGHYHFGAGLDNKPGNMDDWHSVSLSGALEGNTIAMKLHQENLKGATGFDFGLYAEANKADSSLTVHINPLNPIIGYQQWEANKDNFITYTIPTQHVDANLHMKGGDSSLAIYTDEHEGHDSHGHEQEDLVLKLTDIKLSDWIAVNPFAPPIKGTVNADMRLNRTDGELTGHGMASISDFLYGKEKVADLWADFDVSALPSGTIRAEADVLVNGVKTMTLSGALNDTTATSPLALDFSMIRMPLATVNPFLPKTVGRLSGVLNGSLKISGTDSRPVFNGKLDFDTTAVRLAMTGTAYRFSEESIDVVDNIVRLNGFSITACNDRPLTVDGTVDISNLADSKLNLSLKADNMQIVNSKRLAKGADVYGSGFVSLDANVHGSMSLLNVNADVSINSGTNVTYVIPDATSALANRSDEQMVRFVNFSDTAAVMAADTIQPSGMLMFLDATLNIENGTTINVDLSSDGKNRVQLQSNGTLTYSMTPLNDGRLLGRLNINKGYVRYSPPLMSEKMFNFDEGCYVSFSGDMFNPTLNIHATDVIKANVTQSGQNSRLVNFDVLLGVTGTLDKVDVAFDLKTNDDITVANELESMSAEQRANQAMNLLLYNVYTGPGTKGNASLAGNPLFSFLESQLNSWAANNIKGVDISFGIDQYDKTIDGATTSAMSYSYQVSKSLFNDRFKIVVGGNYSTDANADENFSQNLINDISFEYFLNKQRTMYLRLYRHTGYESILEGEITETGVGFVYRRKIMHIVDAFLPQGVVRRREEKRQAKQIREYNEKMQREK